MNKTFRALWERRLTWAYVIMMFAMLFGFFRLEQISDDTDHLAREAAYNNCVSANEAKEGVLFMTQALREYARNQSDQRGGETPEEEQARDKFLEDIGQGLAPHECPPEPIGE